MPTKAQPARPAAETKPNEFPEQDWQETPACLVRYAKDDPSRSEEEYDLSLDEFATLKQHLAQLRQPQPSPRVQKIDARWSEWKAIRSFLQRLIAIEDRMDSPAIWGLLEIYEFMDGDVTEGVGPNWLGKFIFDTLREVAWEGASTVANDPAGIVKDLQGEVENIKDDVLHARDTMNRYPGILAIVEKERKAETGSGHPEQAG